MHLVVDDTDRKILCLQKALKINPENERALKEVQILQRKLTVEQAETSDKIISAVKSTSDPENSQKPLNAPPISAPSVKKPSGTTIDLTAINLQSILAFVGSFFLILGVFLPVINIPLSGQLNLFANGRGDGVIILILALAVVILAVLQHYTWVWVPALVMFALLSSKLINLLRLMAVIDKLTADLAADAGIFGGLLSLYGQGIQLQWGWVFLLIGMVLVLLVPITDPASRTAKLPFFVGLGSALLIFIILVIVNRPLGNIDDLGGSSNSGSVPRRAISAGRDIEYTDGTLRILQVHDPTSFVILESLSLDRIPVEPVPGSRFVAVEFSFTCSAENKDVCESAPEASLELLLDGGRRIDDDWRIYDGEQLGGEAVASGNTVTGWRVFRVPDNGEYEDIIIDPITDSPLCAGLPESVNGYEIEQPWQVLEGDMEFQAAPKLRDALAKRGLVSLSTSHLRDGSNTFLFIEICKDVSVTFSEDEFLRQNREVILNTVSTAANYVLQGELLNFSISDCESFSVYKVTVIFGENDMRDIKAGNFSDAQILSSAFVSFD